MDLSHEILQGLLSASPDAMIAVDSEGSIVFVNDQAERLFGWSRNDLLGAFVERLVPERFVPRHPRLRGGYTAHPTSRPMGAGLELRARRRDGSEFPAEISLSALDSPDGVLVAAAIRDVTMARRAEQRFRAVLSSAPDAIIGVDANGRIELMNGQAERLFGWSADELIGEQVERLVPASVLGRHEAYRASYVADPRPRPMGAGLQLSGRRKDGSTFPAEISLSGVVDELGTLLVLAAVRNVSDRLELEAERQRRAVEAQREQSHRLESLGQLAGGVAHDFNNILGVISNYATLIARRVTDDQVRADVAEIAAATERAAGLTHQLLTFAHRDVANAEALDLNEIVEGVASMLGRTLGEHIELELDLAAGAPVVFADRFQLTQVVLNLAINARDAMSPGGRLTISTELSEGGTIEVDEDRPNGACVLRVIDNGHGMPPDVQARAFEPFFTTKALGEGTGLGLATVYGIVRSLRGAVTIHSVESEGTTVSVELPRIDQRPTQLDEVPGPRGGSERLLLVEDEKALREATARLLAERGYDVTVAADGVEALEILERIDYAVDAVVSDIAMPRMRGDDLAERLRKRPKRIPVILMTGYDSGVGPQSERTLAKPVTEATLLRAIREEVERGDD